LYRIRRNCAEKKWTRTPTGYTGSGKSETRVLFYARQSASLIRTVVLNLQAIIVQKISLLDRRFHGDADVPAPTISLSRAHKPTISLWRAHKQHPQSTPALEGPPLLGSPPSIPPAFANMEEINGGFLGLAATCKSIQS
jgi:hypothetical protein